MEFISSETLFDQNIQKELDSLISNMFTPSEKDRGIILISQDVLKSFVRGILTNKECRCTMQHVLNQIECIVKNGRYNNYIQHFTNLHDNIGTEIEILEKMLESCEEEISYFTEEINKVYKELQKIDSTYRKIKTPEDKNLEQIFKELYKGRKIEDTVVYLAEAFPLTPHKGIQFKPVSCVKGNKLIRSLISNEYSLTEDKNNKTIDEIMKKIQKSFIRVTALECSICKLKAVSQKYSIQHSTDQDFTNAVKILRACMLGFNCELNEPYGACNTIYYEIHLQRTDIKLIAGTLMETLHSLHRDIQNFLDCFNNIKKVLFNIAEEILSEEQNPKLSTR